MINLQVMAREANLIAAFGKDATHRFMLRNHIESRKDAHWAMLILEEYISQYAAASK